MLDNIMAEGKAAKSARDTAEAERNRYAKEKEQLLAFETKLEGQRAEMERAKTTITQLQGWEPKAKEYGAARRNAGLWLTVAFPAVWLFPAGRCCPRWLFSDS